jgi:hypothetical protein
VKKKSWTRRSANTLQGRRHIGRAGIAQPVADQPSLTTAGCAIATVAAKELKGTTGRRIVRGILGIISRVVTWRSHYASTLCGPPLNGSALFNSETGFHFASTSNRKPCS